MDVYICGLSRSISSRQIVRQIAKLVRIRSIEHRGEYIASFYYHSSDCLTDYFFSVLFAS